jgi:hypothetical protein
LRTQQAYHPLLSRCDLNTHTQTKENCKEAGRITSFIIPKCKVLKALAMTREEGRHRRSASQQR